MFIYLVTLYPAGLFFRFGDESLPTEPGAAGADSTAAREQQGGASQQEAEGGASPPAGTHCRGDRPQGPDGGIQERSRRQGMWYG